LRARHKLSVGLADCRAFAIDFMSNKPLFYFIDVGYGKERTDRKINGRDSCRIKDIQTCANEK